MPRKTRPHPEQIRQQVDEIMANWQSYPDFARLFEALLDANVVSDSSFASHASQVTGSCISKNTIGLLRRGFWQPTYQFVSGLADHALLSLDPERLHPARDGAPAGDQRIALFAAAGLIEVTPDSVAQWNRDVLAGWQQRCRESPGRERPTWQELMHKLLEVQTQGGRMHFPDVADAVSTQAGSHHPLEAERLSALLFNTCMPTREERLGLAQFVGLDDAQIGQLERAVKNRTLSLQRRRTHSAFSVLLEQLLKRLRAGGISLRELCLRGKPLGAGGSQLSHNTLSAWKHGKSMPTHSSLRAFVHGLEECRPEVAITPEEIGSLVSAAGFTPEELSATTHDLIARIDSTTRLKPLLAGLRNATDLDVPMTVVAGLGRRGTEGRFVVQLQGWESEALPGCPSLSQMADLLSRYNRLLQKNGREELSGEEIRRVMEVAQRHRQDGLAHGFRKRAHERRPPVPRRTITPDFDSGPPH